jgi:hypothetical protein
LRHKGALLGVVFVVLLGEPALASILQVAEPVEQTIAAAPAAPSPGAATSPNAPPAALLPPLPQERTTLGPVPKVAGGWLDRDDPWDRGAPPMEQGLQERTEPPGASRSLDFESTPLDSVDPWDPTKVLEVAPSREAFDLDRGDPWAASAAEWQL